MFSTKKIHQNIVQKIAPCVGHNADMYGWWILQHVTNQKKEKLLFSDFIITQKTQEEIDTIIKLLVVDSMPLQYILKTIPFGSLTLFVEPPVLIARHETEEWSLWLCEKLKPYQKE